MASQDPASDWGDEKAGLCRSCLHVRLVKTGRGSTFYLCRKSEEDPAYARYPRLPVLRCAGFEPDQEISSE